MATYQQQLVANVLKLFGVYHRTKDEAVLEIVEGLLGCLRDTLETAQPIILPFPQIGPGPITIPMQPAPLPGRPPYDPGGIYVYACPGLEPPFTHIGETESGDTIMIKPGPTTTATVVELDPTWGSSTKAKLDGEPHT